MALALTVPVSLPPATNTAYTITRPAGCTPAVSNLDTNTISMDILDLGTLGNAPKSVSFRVAPTPPTGGHCGIAFNLFGSQTVTPPVFGAGVGFWTHANGLYFDNNGNIYAETWHIDPGTSEAAGQWLDSSIIGQWVAGHRYQVDIVLYADGHYVYHVNDLTYKRGPNRGEPYSPAMDRFYSNNASPTDPSIPIRIRAKSTNGRTNKVAVFHAGAGAVTSIAATPLAIFN